MWGKVNNDWNGRWHKIAEGLLCYLKGLGFVLKIMRCFGMALNEAVNFSDWCFGKIYVKIVRVDWRKKQFI